MLRTKLPPVLSEALPHLLNSHPQLSVIQHDDSRDHMLLQQTSMAHHLWLGAIHCGLPWTGPSNLYCSELVPKVSQRIFASHSDTQSWRWLLTDVRHFQMISTAETNNDRTTTQDSLWSLLTWRHCGITTGLFQISWWVIFLCRSWDQTQADSLWFIPAVYSKFPSCRYSWAHIPWHPSPTYEGHLQRSPRHLGWRVPEHCA